MPPYTPLFEWLERQAGRRQANFANYSFLFTDALYVSSYPVLAEGRGRLHALCLLLGYPMAYAIARSNPTSRNVLLHADRAAVLDLVPAAGLCLDRAPARTTA